MVSDCLDKDWTKFSGFVYEGFANLAYTEYARLVAYRSKGILENLIDKCDFDRTKEEDGVESENRGRRRALFLINRTIQELKHGYDLISNQVDDHIGFYNEKTKTIDFTK
jgi:hypothetical protein